MQDISGFGFQVNLIASNTFPQGIPLTTFADDADAFDTPTQALCDKAMGLNGDLITWSKATPIEATLNVVPNSEDDENLAILAEANRVARGKQSARDVITLVGIYPDGRQVVLSPGQIMSAPPAVGIASSGRMKTRAYAFTFENKTG